MADAYYADNQRGEALFQYTKVFLFYETTGDYENALDIMEDMSNSLASNGELKEAVEFHSERINKASELGLDKVVSDATFDISYTYNGRSAEMAKKNGDHEQSSEALFDIGMSYAVRGDDSSPFSEEFNGKKSKYKEVSEKFSIGR